ncbi:NEW3 domain-containing protein [Salinibacillus aidingensis]|uniref:NEW3 domain-containing protein n=1 Tax=Salinibacillus aidingensis TaxID=237684 RepID=A0ABP3L2C1_9BACI
MFKRKSFILLTLFTLLLSMVMPYKASAAEGVTLYTPLTGLSLTPGETANYEVEIINESNQVKNLELAVSDLPKKWSYTMTADGYGVDHLSVKPNSTKSFQLDIEVPLKVEKGAYNFDVTATSETGAVTTLPMTVNITEQGVFKTELTSDQTNMEGDSESTFTYDVELLNRTASEQRYSLKADAPSGWQVNFKANGKDVTSVTVGSNQSSNITVEVVPSKQASKGTYEIPVTAQAGQANAKLTLESVITGTYGLELTTPDGRLSSDIQAGDTDVITLEVKNTGTSKLENVELSAANTPSEWDVTFEPGTISEIPAGQSVKVDATVKASDKAIAGDYVVEMKASTPEATANSQFRMSVKTSMVWGFAGLAIIIAVVVGIIFLVRKYGRR